MTRIVALSVLFCFCSSSFAQPYYDYSNFKIPTYEAPVRYGPTKTILHPEYVKEQTAKSDRQDIFPMIVSLLFFVSFFGVGLLALSALRQKAKTVSMASQDLANSLESSPLEMTSPGKSLAEPGVTVNSITNEPLQTKLGDSGEDRIKTKTESAQPVSQTTGFRFYSRKQSN